MYKLVVLAVLVVAAQSAILPGLGYAGLAGAPLAYAGAPLAYAGAPLGYAAAPVAIAAPAPAAYALPPVREIAEAPIVETLVEPVEQHGYSVRY